MVRGFALFRGSFETLDLEDLFESESKWTMSKFEISDPEVKMQTIDLPFTNGTYEFTGFNDNLYYQQRTLSISIETSACGDDSMQHYNHGAEYRAGLIMSLKALVGQSMKIIMTNIQKELALLNNTMVYSSALKDFTYSGRLTSVSVDFEDQSHCGVTLNFTCEPYYTYFADICFNSNVNVRYIPMGSGFFIPNNSSSVEWSFSDEDYTAEAKQRGCYVALVNNAKCTNLDDIKSKLTFSQKVNGRWAFDQTVKFTSENTPHFQFKGLKTL